MTITSTEADRMMDFATFIYLRNGGHPDINEAAEFAREMFKEFCSVEGITDVCTHEDWHCEFCGLCEHLDECKDGDKIGTNEEKGGCCGNCEKCDDWNWCQDIDDDDEPDDSQDELGFNPYIGGYDYNC